MKLWDGCIVHPLIFWDIYIHVFHIKTLLVSSPSSVESSQKTIIIPSDTEGFWVEQLVRSHIIQCF
ncbi:MULTISPECIES: hypothetical protein [unclassified Nostoc]|uniref:hypothetical protein n=1 Tax=unclassified Nostoc TaxID=2593658 RepID=UPI002AD1F120|nr:hypothetical protein [Nostoc sp. ChiQUE02]